MQSSKEQQEEIRQPSSVINAKKQRKTTEWERLEISSRKAEIPREHFTQRWAYPSKTLSKNCKGRNTSKLQGHHNPDTKTRQRQHKKRKPQANITDEHRCKNPQQNFNKQNSATHQKAHTARSSWVYSNARILQYMQINQCDTPY